MTSVSPTRGRITRLTACASEVGADAVSQAAARIPQVKSLKPVRVIDGRCAKCGCGLFPERLLKRDDLSELRSKIRLHVAGLREQSCVPGLEDFALRIECRDVLHPAEGNARIE